MHIHTSMDIYIHKAGKEKVQITYLDTTLL